MLPFQLENYSSQGTVALTLLVDRNMRIKKIAGDDVNFFSNISSPVFAEDMYLKEIDWPLLFSTPFQLNNDRQFLFTIDGFEVLYSLHHIQNPSNDFHSIITFVKRKAFIELGSGFSFNNRIVEENNVLILDSGPMQRIVKIIQTISHVDSTVLLLGESGVGKSAIANLIHKMSNRSDKPFISINCGAIPENLIETELFGYEQGTFTGGKKGGKAGLFEVANDGTIFLDEIAELPFNLQAKLLGVLQENAIRKVGGTETKRINVRIIAATNKDLMKLVKEKKFREDLFYRLNVVPLTIPALRERKEDITKLIDYFLSKYNKKYGLLKQLSKNIKEELSNYSWPGNIRELENTIERIVVTNIEEVIDGFLHRADIQIAKEDVAAQTLMPLKTAKRLLEKELILKA